VGAYQISFNQGKKNISELVGGSLGRNMLMKVLALMLI